MKQLSEVLLETWAIKRLREVGLTPDSNATITVREDEEWLEGGCETCGPFAICSMIIAVNGSDALTIDGDLYTFMVEIMGDATPATEEEEEVLEDGIYRAVHGA